MPSPPIPLPVQRAPLFLGLRMKRLDGLCQKAAALVLPHFLTIASACSYDVTLFSILPSPRVTSTPSSAMSVLPLHVCPTARPYMKRFIEPERHCEPPPCPIGLLYSRPAGA